MEKKIYSVLNEMSDYLNAAQLKKLQQVMVTYFAENNLEMEFVSNEEYLQMFLEAKESGRVFRTDPNLLQSDR